MKNEKFRNNEFRPGRLEWFAGRLPAAELKEKYLERNWDDGFVAFSNAEKRFKNFAGAKELARLLPGRIQDCEIPAGLAGLEGFLMEAGLWCHAAGCDSYEELAFEREGEAFFVQYWSLFCGEADAERARPCYYREAGTFIRGNLKQTFPEPLKTFEVILPEERLRFYVTKGGA